VRRLPDFLLIGAPKCGTSALHAALSRHPGLFLSTPKEPKFFLTDGPPPDSGGGPGDVPTWREHVWQRAAYEALFAGVPRGVLCGESTVFYLYDQESHRRIRELLPDARLIAVLRDPAERAHSNWAHLRGADLEPEADFAAALDREPERIEAGWAHFWHYAAQGRYGEQLEHLFGLFPPSRCCCCATGSCATPPGRRWTACAGSSGSSRGSSPVCRGTTSDRTCPAAPWEWCRQSGRLRWRGSPMTCRGCELTGWDLTAWQK
jgi:hypothetical protein